MAVALVVEEPEAVIQADIGMTSTTSVPETSQSMGSSSGSESSGSSTTLGEDTEGTKSDGDDIGLAEEPTVPVAEDDSWYQSIQDFIHQEAEGDTGAPPDFALAHIPRDEVQASGPRSDASRANFAVATLVAKGQVISFQSLNSVMLPSCFD